MRIAFPAKLTSRWTMAVPGAAWMNDMCVGTADWSYQGIDPDRIKHLQECPEYHDLVCQIADQIDPAKVRLVLDVGYLEPVTDAIRPIMYADVDGGLADWFFKGISGYRAQYYRSVESGLRANRYALSKWESKLLQAADFANFEAPHPNGSARTLRMIEADLLKSLRLPSAKKIWGDESQGELNGIASITQNASPQIVAARWVDNATAGIEKACKGIKAPQLASLKFHGGFLKDGNEAIAPDKMHRSENIRCWGFS